jgi:hypothetical protein
MQNAPSWDEVVVGKKFGPLPYRLTEEVVQRFRKVTLANHPWFDQKSPYGYPIVPATLPAGDDFPLIWADLPTGVHAKHTMRLHRPMAVGDQVSATGIVSEKYVRRGKRYFVLQYWLHDDAGRLVCENTGTYVVPEPN